MSGGWELKWDGETVDLQAVVGEMLDRGVPRFTVTETGGLIDPYGQPFTPVGINVNGRNWVWNDPTIGRSDRMVPWHFNTVRINNFMESGGGVAYPDWHGNDDINAICEEYTEAGYVCVIGQHSIGSTTQRQPTDPANMTQMLDWWAEIVPPLAGNPWVWFNPINEPTGGPQGYNAPHWGLDVWEDVTIELCDAISELAPDSMLVLDGHSAGQDKGHPSCLDVPDFTWPPFQYSAAIQKGVAMQERYGRDRVIMSSHFYNEWAGAGQPREGCDGSPADPFSHYRADALYYLNTLQELGVPMMFGEYGARTNYPEEWFIVGANQASEILMDQVAPMRLTLGPTSPRPGILFWHASGGDLRFLRKLESEGGSGIDQNQAFEWNEDPAELNWQGLQMLAYAQAVNP